MQRFHGRHFFSWGPIICLEYTRESTFCTSSVTYHPQIQTDLNHPTIPEVSHVTFRVPRPYWLLVAVREKQGLQQEETRRYLFTLLLLILSLSNAI